MKVITLQIEWHVDDIQLLIQETKQFEKKLRSLFNEVSILMLLQVTTNKITNSTTDRRKEKEKKVTKKKKKKKC